MRFRSGAKTVDTETADHEASRRRAEAVAVNAHVYDRHDVVSSMPVGLPTGPELKDLPPLPTLSPSSPEMVATTAAVAELVKRAEGFEPALAAAYEAGDADTVVALRREAEEVSIRLWAARRAAMEAEIAHYDAERDRIQGFLDVYGRPLGALRDAIRRLTDQEPAYVQSYAHVERTLARIGSRSVELRDELGEMAKGPAAFAAATAPSGGWS